ncbi:hephaestin-like protein [Lingula anatina]|uniref:Hephaestin-like protein n=1 Tax=Lingula anatina TaxID=7574 RepID=A0A1S3HE10_LINAN|nr:hephaestin-like protein [Lingula anatina]|eukprot:XP_013383741.1 hephaestin-like protein [Lingula anatina]
MGTHIVLLCLAVIGLNSVTKVDALVRHYYVAVKEIDWDFAPLGNQVHSRLDSYAAKYLDTSDPNSFGKVFKKAVYREFTDDSFTKEKPHSKHLGLLGPTLRGHISDIIRIKFKNMGSRAYTMHPHGAAYLKKHEGALYTDGTSGDDKLDDRVMPGETITLDWLLSDELKGAPATGDPDCLPWTYHSHLNPIVDVQSGLMGILVICRPGTLDDDNERRDVDKEYILLSHIIDESASWYFQENVARFAPQADQNSPSFATKFHTINGYIYGNVPGLEACSGDRVAWYMIGLGNEDDLHSLTINGHVLEYNHHRTDVIALFAAKFSAAYMTAGDVGKWIIKCQTADHHLEGEQAFLHVSPSCGKPPPYDFLGGHTRTYYIAAVEKRWSYDGGSGLNGYERGLAFLKDPSQESSKYFTKNSNRIGGTYWKIVYEEHTDDKFTTVKRRPLSKYHYGLLGPEIAAQTGDTIKVVFKNLAPSSGRRFSIHPRGVKYDKENEGEDYNDGTPDGGVGYQQTRTYTWTVPESYAPERADSKCITYMYHSAIDPVRDVFSGLIGPLVVCRRGELARRGMEFTLLFANFNENLSWLLEKNILEFASSSASSSPGFEESNIMSSINGYSYGNLPKPTMCLGDQVTWRLLAIGNVIDMHIPTFSGNTFTRFDGNTRDAVSLFPGTTETISMKTVNKGIWSLIDASDDNNVAGMVALYKVDQCHFFLKHPLAHSEKGITRTYYIAVVERMWEYAPWRFDLILGKSITDPSSTMYVFARTDWPFLGTRYKKALYREYTDATFTVEKTRSPEEEHLAIMGPFIKAEVTDTIKVVFKNMASRPYSIHPNLVMYSKEDEGHAYKDGVNVTAGVPPGGIKTYTWEVPKSSGPGKNDPNCISSAYRSAVNLEKDLASGMVGPMALCRKGTLSENKRRDVEKEIATLWTIFDENDSWYLDENIMSHPQYPGFLPDKTDAEFLESNRFHPINGLITARDPGFNMKECDLVAWYFISFGGRVDIHTVHFHANSYIWNTESAHRGDTLEVFPGIFEVATMLADDPGSWLMHCHVDDHVGAGMITEYLVEKSEDPVQCSSVDDEDA